MNKQKDSAFYKNIWQKNEDFDGYCYCEECGLPLEYSASFVSHNLSRGAHPEPFFRWNENNVSILCIDHHRQWEVGNRKEMKIYPAKKSIMDSMLQQFHK